jgi:Putative mono-oxygenase ydhR
MKCCGKWPLGPKKAFKEDKMITALVQFNLPQPLSREKAREIFSGTAPRYREIPGLIRKYYILSQDGGTAGGVYLWHSMEDAERLYTDEWKNFIFGKYGTLPSVTYFESPVIVDNTSGEIITDR